MSLDPDRQRKIEKCMQIHADQNPYPLLTATSIPHIPDSLKRRIYEKVHKFNVGHCMTEKPPKIL